MLHRRLVRQALRNFGTSVNKAQPGNAGGGSGGVLRRFYDKATVGQTANRAHWTVLLDNKPLKTPGGSELQAPTEKAAQLIATEWDSQEETVAFQKMPLSCLAIQALDLVSFPDNRVAVEKETLKFLNTDTLLMRPTTPENEQEKKRLDQLYSLHATWIQDDIQKLYQLSAPLQVSQSLDPPQQNQCDLDTLALQVRKRDPWKLSCLFAAVRHLKSYLLGLALTENVATVSQIVAAATVERIYQEARWGCTEESKRETEDLQLWLTAAHTLHHSV